MPQARFAPSPATKVASARPGRNATPNVGRVQPAPHDPGGLACSHQLADCGGDRRVGLVDGVLRCSRVQRVAQTVLDPHVVGQPLEPHPEGIERLMPGEHIAYRVDEHLDVVPVHRKDQRLTGREVPVERARADTSPMRDRVQRRVV